MLVLEEEFGRSVKSHGRAVESGINGIKETIGKGEEGHELNVGVVVRVIRNDCVCECELGR